MTQRSQRLLSGNSLAPEFTEADIRQGQHPNGSVNPDSPEYLELGRNNYADYSLTVTGLVESPLALPYSRIKSLPARTQITRHDCVEGWSCIGKWTGTPLGTVLDLARPKPAARYAVFHCYDAIERSLSGTVQYYESIDLIDAYHPQTILAYGLNDAPLPVANGAPLRLVVPWKYGFKSIKSIVRISLVRDEPVNTWQALAPNEYGFYANVNPQVDHPRWSQAQERRLPSSLFSPNVMKTRLFNGYDEVAGLYSDLDLRKYY